MSDTRPLTAMITEIGVAATIAELHDVLVSMSMFDAATDTVALDVTTEALAVAAGAAATVTTTPGPAALAFLAEAEGR